MGQVITSIKAVDLDADANALVSYSMEGPWRIGPVKDDYDDDDDEKVIPMNEGTIELVKRKLNDDDDNGTSGQPRSSQGQSKPTKSQSSGRMRDAPNVDLELTLEDETFLSIVNQTEGTRALVLARELGEGRGRQVRGDYNISDVHCYYYLNKK